jgi:hypothetical protein
MTGSLLSQIRIVDTDRILPFEWLPNETAGMDQSSDDARYVRHPFPVLDLQEGNYLLLDQVERFVMLSQAGLPHLPVQVCPRKGIHIASVRLGLVDFDREDLQKLAARYPDQIVVPTAGQSSQGYIVGLIDFRDGESVPVFFRDSSRSGCAGSIDIFFRALRQHGDYLPVVDQGDHTEAIFKAATFSAFLSLPPVTLESLETAATADRPFPPGLISVQTESRVFYVDFPQSVLRSEIPSREKEAFLRDLLLLREQSRRTSHYQGQIYILNQ